MALITRVNEKSCEKAVVSKRRLKSTWRKNRGTSINEEKM
nr:MAG TPA: hypothetical protein [Bacteriophage sp.]